MRSPYHHGQRYFTRKATRMKTALVWRFDADDEVNNLDAVRLTLTTPTMRDVGTHARLLREATEAWRADTGIKVETDTDAETSTEPTPPDKPGEKPEDKQENNVLYNQYTRWPTLAVCTKKVEILKRSKKERELDNEAVDQWAWEQSSLEALGWNSPAGVLDLPVDFFTSWEQFCMRVSPGVFGPPLTSANAKKKTGLVSVV